MIKKKFLTDKPACKVTFSISNEIAKKFKKANLVGDFNNWDTHATEMKKMKRDGSFSVTLELDLHREYEFRYLLNGEVWLNEPEADKQVPTYFEDAENSVVSI